MSGIEFEQLSRLSSGTSKAIYNWRSLILLLLLQYFRPQCRMRNIPSLKNMSLAVATRIYHPVWWCVVTTCRRGDLSWTNNRLAWVRHPAIQQHVWTNVYKWKDQTFLMPRFVSTFYRRVFFHLPGISVMLLEILRRQQNKASSCFQCPAYLIS